MAGQNSQWRPLKTDSGANPVDAVVANMPAPTATDKIGVLCANARKLTVRGENIAGAGTYDLTLWLQYAVDETWYKNAAAVSVTATVPQVLKVDCNGAIRAYAQCDNFAAAASAQVRISGGD